MAELISVLVTENFIEALKNPHYTVYLFGAKFNNPQNYNNLGDGIAAYTPSWFSASSSDNTIEYNNINTGDVSPVIIADDYSSVTVGIPYKNGLTAKTVGYLTYSLSSDYTGLNNASNVAFILDRSLLDIGSPSYNGITYIKIDLSDYNIAATLRSVSRNTEDTGVINDRYHWMNFIGEHKHSLLNAESLPNSDIHKSSRSFIDAGSLATYTNSISSTRAVITTIDGPTDISPNLLMDFDGKMITGINSLIPKNILLESDYPSNWTSYINTEVIEETYIMADFKIRLLGRALDNATFGTASTSPSPTFEYPIQAYNTDFSKANVYSTLNGLYINTPDVPSTRRLGSFNLGDVVPLFGSVASDTTANTSYYGTTFNTAKYANKPKVCESVLPYMHAELIKYGTLPIEVLPKVAIQNITTITSFTNIWDSTSLEPGSTVQILWNDNDDHYVSITDGAVWGGTGEVPSGYVLVEDGQLFIVVDVTAPATFTMDNYGLQMYNSASVAIATKAVTNDGICYPTFVNKSDTDSASELYKDTRFSYDTGSGELTVQSVNTVSSRKYKTDISNYTDDACEILDAVTIVNFKYVSDTNNDTHIGFIADDTDSRLSGPKHDRMRITDCIGLIIKAIQEILARIRNLENRMNKVDGVNIKSIK